MNKNIKKQSKYNKNIKNKKYKLKNNTNKKTKKNNNNNNLKNYKGGNRQEHFEIRSPQNIDYDKYRLAKYVNTQIDWRNMPGTPPRPDCCIL